MNETQYLTETSSGGVAFTDLNNDNLPDLFFTGGPQHGNFLFLNRGSLPFENGSDKAGIRKPGWATGVTAGDFDADGDLDLLVTYWQQLALFANRGDATFDDVTARSGLPNASHWYSGATFLDYDRDGDLDLFLATYTGFDREKIPKPGENPNCNWKGVAVPCGPRGLPAGRRFLYRNEGGRFTDVTAGSGIDAKAQCYGMTAVSFDVDSDGWPDIYLACDSTASLLYLNVRNGTFREEGIERGLALSDDGREQAGMGIALGDINADGHTDLLKTHFADDVHGLYRNNGKGEFADIALAAGLGIETRMVGWGAAIEDFDKDAWPDLFIATGNVYPNTEARLPAYPYRTPPLLFRNLGDGSKFEQLFTGQAGEPIATPASTRGAAFADYDNDGDIDIALWNRNAPPALLRNDAPGVNQWIRLHAPLGSRIEIRYGGRAQVRYVLSQASFYSVNDQRVHFGLGRAIESVDATVTFPSGAKRSFARLATNREHRLRDRSE
jgi:hypothetical protein